MGNEEKIKFNKIFDQNLFSKLHSESALLDESLVNLTSEQIPNVSQDWNALPHQQIKSKQFFLNPIKLNPSDVFSTDNPNSSNCVSSYFEKSAEIISEHEGKAFQTPLLS